MKAEISQRIRMRNRTPLQDVIPLDTPFHIFVDPSAACNFSCRFCFNRDKSRTNHRILKFELFRKIVDDIKQFPRKLKVLRLYKEGEPLHNKYLPDMIRYAKQKDIAETVDFTTNGSLLTREKSRELIDAGLDAINISVEGVTSDRYMEVSRARIDFDEFVDNLAYFYKNKGNCRMLIKTTDINVPKEDEHKFFSIFGDICDEISIEQVVPIWNDIDISDVKTEFDKGIYNQEKKDIQVCPYIFYSMTINSDGSVSSCFSDWQHANIIGDVKENPVVEIWNGEGLKALRIAHLTRKKSLYKVCADCMQLKYATIDNIDPFADVILERIQ